MRLLPCDRRPPSRLAAAACAALLATAGCAGGPDAAPPAGPTPAAAEAAAGRAAPPPTEEAEPGTLPRLGETDRVYQEQRTLRVGSHTLSVHGRVLLDGAGGVLAAGLVEAPAVAPAAICAASEGPDGDGRLDCWRATDDALVRVAPLAVGGRPDRVALDGERVAWVASPAGLPQVHCAPLDGPARALTNVDLPRPAPGVARGGPPPGWVPPPHQGRLRWAGARVEWTSPRGEEGVTCP